MTHAEAIARWLKADGVGVEIGAGQTPVPGIRPIYVDRFAEFAGKKCHADYWGDACHLPFHNHSLDYVVSSHVLEHVANPVAALLEWYRVLQHNGVIYAVVPDRRHTFDQFRALTEPEHMWDDYQQGTNQCDASHYDEYLDNLDWSRFRPDLPADQIPTEREALRKLYQAAARSEDNREFNIHFHVFEPSNLRTLVERVIQRLHLPWTIVALQESFPDDCPNGILLVIRVRQGLGVRWRSFRERWGGPRGRLSAVRADARPLSDDVEMRQKH